MSKASKLSSPLPAPSLVVCVRSHVSLRISLDFFRPAWQSNDVGLSFRLFPCLSVFYGRFILYISFFSSSATNSSSVSLPSVIVKVENDTSTGKHEEMTESETDVVST